MKDKNEHKVLQLPKKKQPRVVLEEPDKKTPQLMFKIKIEEEE